RVTELRVEKLQQRAGVQRVPFADQHDAAIRAETRSALRLDLRGLHARWRLAGCRPPGWAQTASAQFVGDLLRGEVVVADRRAVPRAVVVVLSFVVFFVRMTAVPECHGTTPNEPLDLRVGGVSCLPGRVRRLFWQQIGRGRGSVNVEEIRSREK